MSGQGADAGRIGPVRRVMRRRDPGEEHRAATPLELLFDLTFVVAVAQAAAQLHHALAEVGDGLAASSAPKRRSNRSSTPAVLERLAVTLADR